VWDNGKNRATFAFQPSDFGPASIAAVRLVPVSANESTLTAVSILRDEGVVCLGRVALDSCSYQATQHVQLVSRVDRVLLDEASEMLYVFALDDRRLLSLQVGPDSCCHAALEYAVQKPCSSAVCSVIDGIPSLFVLHGRSIARYVVGCATGLFDNKAPDVDFAAQLKAMQETVRLVDVQMHNPLLTRSADHENGDTLGDAGESHHGPRYGA